MMWDFLCGDRVILASSSPRRVELLRNVGLSFEQKPSEIVEEMSFGGHSPADMAVELSRRKAFASALGETSGWVLGADTVVALEDEILGKPSSEDEARAILRKLSGRMHVVITGYTIVHIPSGRAVSDYDMTAVSFWDYSNEEIEMYVDTGEPLDKAGAYGIQGIGGLLVERIEGCYFNVVGLPLAKLRRCWMEFYREIADANNR